MKAYSYIRFSSNLQIGNDSVRRQVELSEAYARKHNLELVNSIDGRKLQDLGVSAFRSKNLDENLGLILSYISKGIIEKNSYLLIENFDRLSRDDITSAISLFTKIINESITIVTLQDEQIFSKEILENNPYLIFMTISSFIRANEESVVKSRRIKAAWKNKHALAKSDKKPISKICPMWLRLSDDRKCYEIIVDRVEIIKKIFELSSIGYGRGSIVRYLNENNIKSFKTLGHWSTSSMKKLLSNRALIGQLILKDEIIEDFFPKIIEKELFERIQIEIKNRKTSAGKNGKRFANLFKSILYCNCGQRMVQRVRNESVDAVKKRFNTYICHSKLYKSGCYSYEYSQEMIEKLVFSHLREVNFDEILNENNSNELEIQNEILKCESANENLQKKLDNLMELAEESNLNKAVKIQLVEKMNDGYEEFEKNNAKTEDLKSKLKIIISSKKDVESLLSR